MQSTKKSINKSIKNKVIAKPKEEVLEVDNYEEDDEAQPMGKASKNQAPKQAKKDMKSLFADSDDDEEEKKIKEEIKAKQERMRNVMKQIVREGN